ncbi:hypothetical protein ACIBCT_35375 [Streptosporangium sp. NPDC050855]|uniref:hypothetical protein n=1 Tax=Streptosporangium sp. NPDC050855 TaxID=3366194 RepID=UPI0037AFB920
MSDNEHGELEAWSKYYILGDDEEAVLHWSTNDDGDTGYPGTFASDSRSFHRREDATALQQAVRHAGGGSRQGIGHNVHVYINGEEYKGGKDCQPEPSAPAPLSAEFVMAMAGALVAGKTGDGTAMLNALREISPEDREHLLWMCEQVIAGIEQLREDD